MFLKWPLKGDKTEEKESEDQNKSEPSADRVNEQPQNEAEECEPEIKTDIEPVVAASESSSQSAEIETEPSETEMSPVDKPTTLPSVVRSDVFPSLLKI